MHHTDQGKMVGKPSYPSPSHWRPPFLAPPSKPLPSIPEGGLPPSPPFDMCRFPGPQFQGAMGHLYPLLQLQREMMARSGAPHLPPPTESLHPEILHMILRQAAMARSQEMEVKEEAGEARRQEDCASPPRMEEREEEEKLPLADPLTPPVKAETEFAVADSIKEQGLFKDQTQLEKFRDMLNGVNSSATKQMLGEKEWQGGEEVEQYEDSVTSEGGGGEGQDDRKVRVRTLISEEQLHVLKQHYASNPSAKEGGAGGDCQQDRPPLQGGQGLFPEL